MLREVRDRLRQVLDHVHGLHGLLLVASRSDTHASSFQNGIDDREIVEQAAGTCELVADVFACPLADPGGSSRVAQQFTA